MAPLASVRIADGLLWLNSGAAANFSIDAGAALVTNLNATIGALSGAGDVALNHELTLDGADSTTFEGRFQGFGGLVKAGAGTLTLTGDSNSGHLSVQAGRLVVEGSFLPKGQVSVAAGAHLDVLSGGVLDAPSLLVGGSVRVSGAGSRLSLDDISNDALMNGAEARLILEHAGELSIIGAGELHLSTVNGTAGALIIGAEQGEAAVAAGSLVASGVVAGDGAGSLVFNHTNAAYEFDTRLHGAIDLRHLAGQTILTAQNDTFTGDVWATGGALFVENVLGSTSSDVVVDGAGTLIVREAGQISAATAVIGGAGHGALTLTDGGSLIVGNGLGDVVIARDADSSGRLVLGEDAGVSAERLVFGDGDGALDFNRGGTASFEFDVALVGAGSVNVNSGMLALTGANTDFTGVTTIGGGASQAGVSVAGVLGGDVVVGASGMLVGDVGGGLDSSILGDVWVQADGELRGFRGATLGMGSLMLDADALVHMTLGAPGGDGLFSVDGDLTLDGALSVQQDPGFGEGVYRLFDYTGDLTDNGLEIAVLDPNFMLEVQTAIGGQVNLLAGARNLWFWDGIAANAGNDSIDGGAGVWTATNDAFTDARGEMNGVAAPTPAFVVFTSAPGVVTIDETDGAVGAGGLQFAVDGYSIVGDALTLSETQIVIRVSDGTAAGAGYGALIASDIVAAGDLVKSDLGVLTLTGASDLVGGLAVEAGGLVLDGGSIVQGGVIAVADGAALDVRGGGVIEADNLALDGATRITGAGSSITLSGLSAHATLDGAAARLVLSEGGELSIDNARSLYLAGHAGSAGTLVIGAEEDESAVGAGYLRASAVQTFGGAGTIVFNHTNDAYEFDAALGEVALRHVAGETILTAHSVGFAGDVSVTGGSLAVENTLGAVARGVVAVEGMGSLIVRNGGTMVTTATTIGGVAGSDAELTIGDSNPDSGAYYGIGLTTVGGAGSGLLKIQNASMWTNDVVLGAAATGEGRMEIGGLDTFLLADSLVIGGAGSGNLVIGPGGGIAIASGLGDVVIARDAGSDGHLMLADTTSSYLLGAGRIVFGDGDGRLSFDSSSDESPHIFRVELVGDGRVEVVNGVLVMDAVTDNFTGVTRIGGESTDRAELSVMRMLGGDVVIDSGGVLSNLGAGIRGDVSVLAGGSLTAVGGLTMSIGSLTLASDSTLEVLLHTPDVGALFSVDGDLTLDGDLHIEQGPTFGEGVYRLFDYTGDLIDNGLEIATLNFDFMYDLQTAIGGQVNLLASTREIWFWDGDTASAGNNAIDGGSGIWSATNDVFTDARGEVNAAPAPTPAFLVFGAAPGVVTIDDADGAVTASGLQFSVDGYSIVGDALTLSEAQTIIRVGDGTAAGADYGAVIASDIAAAGDLVKSDLGVLTLTGASELVGGLVVQAGGLVLDGGRIEQGGAINVAAGAHLDVLSGGSLQADRLDVAGTLLVSGDGSSVSLSGTSDAVLGDADSRLILADDGQLRLAGGRNLHLSRDASSTGTLVIGAEEGEAAVDGGWLDATVVFAGAGAGSVVFNHTTDDYGFAAVLGGEIDLRHLAGETILAADSYAFTGDVSVTGGALIVEGALGGDAQPDVVVDETGMLVLREGGWVSAGNLIVGATLGADAALSVVDSGSRLSVSSLVVGGAGSGNMTVGEGGHVTVVNGAGDIVIARDAGSSGHLALEATTSSEMGYLEAARIVFGAGDGRLSFDSNFEGAPFTLDVELVGDGRVDIVNGVVVMGAVSDNFTGVTTVGGGLANLAGLSIAGTLGGNVVVDAGGVLVGDIYGRSDSSILGNVSVLANGALGGLQGMTLSMGSLTLDSDAVVQVILGAPGGNGLISVAGDLTLDGDLYVQREAGFGEGLYRLIDYTGDLTDNGLEIGALDFDFMYDVQTAIGGQVNLLASTREIWFWDGDTANADNDAIDGGSGIWSATNDAFTDARGVLNAAPTPTPAFLVFGSAPGVVTIDDADGAVTAGGLQFAVDGYSIVGDPLMLTGVETVIRVGDGTSAGVGFGALIASDIVGAGDLVKSDLGVLTLTGDLTYAGDTEVRDGALVLAGQRLAPLADVRIGDAELRLVDGARLQADHIAIGDGAESLMSVSGGSVVEAASIAMGETSGSSSLLVLAGANSTLEVGSDVIVGSEGAGDVRLQDGARLVVDGVVTLGGEAEGQGALLIGGEATAQAAGILEADGLVFGPGEGSIRFNHTGLDHVFAVAMSGDLHSAVHAAGVTRFTGASQDLSGTLDVTGGTVLIDGSFGAAITVGSGASVGGAGEILNHLQIEDGGVLIGRYDQVLALNSLVLSSGSRVDVTLGGPMTTVLFDVAGDLTLDGTLDVSSTPDFGAGVYRLFSYGGDLTDNGLAIGLTPAGASVDDFFVQTAVDGRVSVISTVGDLELLFWDGGQGDLYDNDAINGGAGVWSSTGRAWTKADGAINGAYSPNPGYAVFQGQGDVVTVSGTDVGVTGVQFAVDGYEVGGDSVELSAARTVVRVGDGTAAGADMTATIASVLTGAGGLVKTDLGTLILTGANTYEGGTEVRDGALVGDTASIRGDVLNDAVLVFDQGVDGTLSGDLSGSGQTFKRGEGTLTLAGSNATDWTVESGKLAATAGRFAGDVEIGADGIFTLTATTDQTWSGTISGQGVFEKAGEASLILTGDASGFRGVTDILEGVLVVNGVLGGELRLAEGARLGGSGTLSELRAAAGVTIAPGNSIGTLNVAGDVTFEEGSIYEVEVDPNSTASDRIVSGGFANLNGGIVRHIGEAGSYQPYATYTILTAVDGVRGRFEGIETDFAFLDASLDYEPNAVLMTLVRNDIAFPDIGESFNQRSTGAAVEATGRLAPLYRAVVGLSADNARVALDSLSGDLHGTIRTAQSEATWRTAEAITRRLDAAFAQEDGLTFWGHARGGLVRSESDGNAASLAHDSAGLTMGADAGGPNGRLGMAAGVTTHNYDSHVRRGSATGTSVSLAAYGSARWDSLSLKAAVSGTWHEVDSMRRVAFPGFADVLEANYDADTVHGFVEAAWRVSVSDSVAVAPFANLSRTRARTEAFAETGGAAALEVQGQDQVWNAATVGLDYSQTLSHGEAGAMTTLTARLGWRHAWGDTESESRQSFVGESEAFTVRGLPVARDTLIAGLGVDSRVSDTLAISVNWSAQQASDLNAHDLKVTMNWRF